MSCSSEPIGLANVPLLLIQVEKSIQQIGNRTGERFQFPPYLGFLSTYF
jgi:hypothetical protein